MSKRQCPKCGSNAVSTSRVYNTREASPRFVHALADCLDCGHESEKFGSPSEAYAAWRVEE